MLKLRLAKIDGVLLNFQMLKKNNLLHVHPPILHAYWQNCTLIKKKY